MNPDGTPLDSLSMMVLVQRAIGDIDTASDDDRDELLFNLLCAAWPETDAQNQ